MLSAKIKAKTMLSHCLTLLKADKVSCTSSLSSSQPWLSCNLLSDAASCPFYLIHIGAGARPLRFWPDNSYQTCPMVAIAGI